MCFAFKRREHLGAWSLHKDGRPIPVRQVYRHSRPRRQDYFEIGYKAPAHADQLDLDHHFFLVLEEAVGSRAALRIQGPMGLDLNFDFDDRRATTPVIQVNQVGYSPRATQRWARSRPR